MEAKPACAKDRGKMNLNVISEIRETNIFYDFTHAWNVQRLQVGGITKQGPRWK